uniref:Uncharacterized protein n=1 Tax=Romanomermis culicivorax TaxID=13658 RepID=A0A915JNB9_ROMCU
MWKEATLPYINHIDQEAAGSYCSYQEINHKKVLRVDSFPMSFRNHVMADRTNKPKLPVRNPKKTREELQKEEEEMYVYIDETEPWENTDPDTQREYEALGSYLSSDPSDVQLPTLRMLYGPHFKQNDPILEPTTLRDAIGKDSLTFLCTLCDIKFLES